MSVVVRHLENNLFIAPGPFQGHACYKRAWVLVQRGNKEATRPTASIMKSCTSRAHHYALWLPWARPKLLRNTGNDHLIPICVPHLNVLLRTYIIWQQALSAVSQTNACVLVLVHLGQPAIYKPTREACQAPWS